jgi:hypothetical protein
MLKRLFLIAVLVVAFAAPAAPLHAQRGPRPPINDATSEKPAAAKPNEPKKYDDVITKNAKTFPGVFTVHRIEDKIYFEIPTDGFDRLMLWQAEVVKGPAGVSWGGQAIGRNYLRWERRGNKVYLWQASFAKRGDGKAIQSAVDSANLGTIILSFNVEAEGKDRSTVINATPLYLSDVVDLSVKGAVGGGAGAVSVDDSRSYLEEIKAFPTNIEARSLLTFRGGGAGGSLLGRLPVAAAPGGAGRSHSALIHYSLVALPEQPMTGRFFDPRVGYFTESFENYASPTTWMDRQQYIARFRLEKKDPTAEVSEPIKPIVFYVSREVPEKWRPYLLKGIEDWKPAFEKAGFKNAIIAKEAPDPRQDPTWDPEDARYSVIRWVAEPVQNAMGPHVHDPRSGEVISAHIIFWHDILKMTQVWYFVQCSAQDPRARKLPLPEEVTGELMRYVTAHEVGHTLGLRHNHRASSAYSVAQLRDPKFTEKHGTVGSIMAYGRFNYVCQPEDKVKQLIPLIGPYDDFAISWGYKPVAGAKTAETERATLDKWAARQLEEPWLRFGGEDGPAMVDPTVKTENISDDSLLATELGLKNVDRVLEHLVAATTTQGEDFSLLEETYKAILTHRRNWFNAVALNVGGVMESRTLGGRGTESFSRVPKERQREAVRFLLNHALTTPSKLLDPAIVNRFKYNGVAAEVTGQQSALLRSLLGGSRLRRLADAEVLLGDQAYTATELVNDVQDGVWQELHGQAIKIDPLRRSLQRTYLEILKNELAPAKEDARPQPLAGDDSGSASGTDFKAIAREAVALLKQRIEANVPRAGDSITRIHLKECGREIDVMLSDKK